MSTAIENAIVERLHCLSEARQAEVLDVVEYLASKPGPASSAVEWSSIDPLQDLAKYIGVSTGLPTDGVAYQRQIRDAEWP